MAIPRTPASAFAARRAALAELLGPRPALLAAGLPRARNYPANRYPFRASSHFLYLLGEAIPGAALLIAGGESTLFVEPPASDDELWHGVLPGLPELRTMFALSAVRPIGELDAVIASLGGGGAIGTLPTQDDTSTAWLADKLGRAIRPRSGHDLAPSSADEALANAMITLRRRHDDAALAQLRAVTEVTAGAHVIGMRATRSARFEHEIAGAMIGELRRHGLEDSYGPIVTIRGEILHNETHKNPVAPGDLLLADVGGETAEGWAADITRVWPVSGTFSATQRDLYEVVLRAQVACVSMVKKGVRYRAIHETAGRTIVEGLRDLGIFKGEVEGLYERGAASIFFPHGIGHLLGLDVHDMEDLGDRAAYAPGRVRSKRFGDCYLRLDLDLEPGMAVTIEPGYYNVPAILRDDAITGAVGKDLDRSVLERFADVRGIRIEDDVLCTDGEPEVLTRAVPKGASEVEAIVRSGAA